MHIQVEEKLQRICSTLVSNVPKIACMYAYVCICVLYDVQVEVDVNLWRVYRFVISVVLMTLYYIVMRLHAADK
jgi:undecaprenyl pyrophosphate phosphatase UppP